MRFHIHTDTRTNTHADTLARTHAHTHGLRFLCLQSPKEEGHAGRNDWVPGEWFEKDEDTHAL